MLDAGFLNQHLPPGEIRTERRGSGISNLAFYDGKLSVMWLCLHGHAATGFGGSPPIVKAPAAVARGRRGGLQCQFIRDLLSLRSF
jgi:hypothetical protein